MLDFCFKRGPLKIRELAFAEMDDTIKKCDVAYYHANKEKCGYLPNKAFIVNEQYTLISDLTQEEEILQKGIKKNCAYEIRRAEREGALFQAYTSFDELEKDKVIDAFENTYNDMFKSKNMHMKFNRALVEAGVKAGHCIITISKIPVYDNVVVYHAYLQDDKNSMLMYSASTIWGNDNKDIVNCIGRMNKFLHWKDLLYFKQMGISKMEWGGISSADKPNGIDKFKMEFGGTVVCYKNYIIANSLLGKLYVNLIKHR